MTTGKISGNIHEFEIKQDPFITADHPPVLISVELPDDLVLPAGETVLPRGLFLAKDASGDWTAYNPDAVPAPEATPLGILARDVDPTKDTAGTVLVHGTVLRDKCVVRTETGEGEETVVEFDSPDAEDWAKLFPWIMGR